MPRVAEVDGVLIHLDRRRLAGERRGGIRLGVLERVHVGEVPLALVARLEAEAEGRVVLDDAGGDDVDLAVALDAVDRPFAVLRVSEGVDDAPEVSRTHRDVEHATGAADLVAFVQAGPLTHDHRTDVVLFEVQRECRDRFTGLGRRDLEHLGRHRFRETVDARDTVLYLEDFADLLGLKLVLVALDLVEQDVLDLAGAELGVVGHLENEVSVGRWEEYPLMEDRSCLHQNEHALQS